MEINSLHIVGKLIKKQKYSEYGDEVPYNC